MQTYNMLTHIYLSLCRNMDVFSLGNSGLWKCFPIKTFVIVINCLHIVLMLWTLSCNNVICYIYIYIMYSFIEGISINQSINKSITIKFTAVIVIIFHPWSPVSANHYRHRSSINLHPYSPPSTMVMNPLWFSIINVILCNIYTYFSIDRRLNKILFLIFLFKISTNHPTIKRFGDQTDHSPY